jgi:hypothetical protein
MNSVPLTLWQAELRQAELRRAELWLAELRPAVIDAAGKVSLSSGARTHVACRVRVWIVRACISSGRHSFAWAYVARRGLRAILR